MDPVGRVTLFLINPLRFSDPTPFPPFKAFGPYKDLLNLYKGPIKKEWEKSKMWKNKRERALL